MELTVGDTWSRSPVFSPTVIRVRVILDADRFHVWHVARSPDRHHGQYVRIGTRLLEHQSM